MMASSGDVEAIEYSSECITNGDSDGTEDDELQMSDDEELLAALRAQVSTIFHVPCQVHYLSKTALL